MLKIINAFLDNIKDKGKILLQVENLNCKYKGEIEDTINGKREIFYIERKTK